MNDARLKQIEANHYITKSGVMRELITALRESQAETERQSTRADALLKLTEEFQADLRETRAREAKARDIIISTIKSANNLEDQLDKISGGHAAIAESILVNIQFDLRATREALKEGTKP